LGFTNPAMYTTADQHEFGWYAQVGVA
jgi:hypothetical protein